MTTTSMESSGPVRGARWSPSPLPGSLTLGALLIWVLRTTGGMLREQLKSLQFWSLEACVILGLALGAVVARDHLERLDRRDRLRMAGLTALALALTLFVAPRTNRIYYDEQIYQSIGQNLADLRLAQMCNDGTVEYGRLQCWSGEYNKQPYAYPHLLSLAYRAVGVRPAAAFAVNAVVMALTVCWCTCSSLMLFDDRHRRVLRRTARCADARAAHVVGDRRGRAVGLAGVRRRAARAACTSFDREARRRSRLAVVSAAYAVQFRPESLLIVPGHRAAAVAVARARNSDAPRLWWVGLLVRGARGRPRRPPVRGQE